MFSSTLSSGVFVLCTCALVMLIPSVSAADVVKGVTLATVSEIEAEVNLALNGANDMEHRSISAIERSVSTGFRALPKNNRGLLERPALNYLVHRYFMKEHGWDVKGLDANNRSNEKVIDETMGVLLENLPSLIEQREAFLANRNADGFFLRDAAVIISALDHLILNEHRKLLEASYNLRGFDDAARHKMAEVDAVVTSYVLLYYVGGSLTDAQKHMRLIRQISLPDTPFLGQTFFLDEVKGQLLPQIHKLNPFAEPTFSFDDTWSALSEAMRLWGTFEDIECMEMKGRLTDMDPMMSGRVPLGRFYKPRSEGAEQLSSQFTESVEYLRQLGALDESGGEPQVLITNYILSSTNCAKDTAYYGVCCKSECEVLMDQLEEGIGAPTAPAEVILSLVVGSDDFSEPVIRALWQVSDIYDGEVPLHGRLFAQWMHYAFPHQCPYPHTSSTAVSKLSTEMFQAQTGIKWEASDEEKSNHVQKMIVGHVVPHMSQWTLDEELYVGAPRRSPGIMAKVATSGAQAAVLVCIAMAVWKASARMVHMVWLGVAKADVHV